MHNRMTHKPPPTFDQVYWGCDIAGAPVVGYVAGSHELHVRFDRSIPVARQRVLVDNLIRECFSFG